MCSITGSIFYQQLGSKESSSAVQIAGSLGKTGEAVMVSRDNALNRSCFSIVEKDFQSQNKHWYWHHAEKRYVNAQVLCSTELPISMLEWSKLLCINADIPIWFSSRRRPPCPRSSSTSPTSSPSGRPWHLGVASTPRWSRFLAPRGKTPRAIGR